MPTIRKAEFRDAKPLAILQERTFRDTFEDTNTPEDLTLHCQAHFSESIQAQELSDPGLETLVCEHDSQLIAFAQLRWTSKPDCVRAERPAEIQRFYVLKGWHGQGLAQKLMAASIEAVTRRGADQVWLGVWEHNPRAIAFYRRWGFEEVGAHIFPLGTDPQRDIIMTRPIAHTG